VDTNGSVKTPTNFWVANAVAAGTYIPTQTEAWVDSEAEAAIDVTVPDLLEDYYQGTASDIRYQLRGATLYPSGIVVSNTYLHFSGPTLEDILSSIDDQMGAQITLISNNVINIQVVTNLYMSIVTNAVTNITVQQISLMGTASQIRTSFAPTNYSPSTNTVEGHLRAIDSKFGSVDGSLSNICAWLAHIENVITNLAAGVTNVTVVVTNPPAITTNRLISVAITGANTANEGTDEEYTLTASFSDGSTANVSADLLRTAWTFAGAHPANVTLATNWLKMGSFAFDTSIVIRATYSSNGIARQGEKLVNLVDTNPPALASVTLSGTNSIDEGGHATYTTTAVFDQGITQDVTTAATYDFSGAVPSGTAWSNNVLTVGAVASNTVIHATAMWAFDSVIRIATNDITVVNGDQMLTFDFAYGGAYSTGVLYVEGYTNATMQGWAVWKYSTPFASVGGELSLTTNSVLIRNYGSGQFAGYTYWFAWLDNDADGRLNGDILIQNNGGLDNDLRDAGAIPAGQTATNGPLLVTGAPTTLSFTLTDSGDAGGTHRIGWLPSDGKRMLNRLVCIYDLSGGSRIVFVKWLRIRSYVCDQDFLLGPYYSGKSYPLAESNYKIQVFDDVHGAGEILPGGGTSYDAADVFGYMFYTW
jgi:hypothetical protein